MSGELIKLKNLVKMKLSGVPDPSIIIVRTWVLVNRAERSFSARSSLKMMKMAIERVIILLR